MDRTQITPVSYSSQPLHVIKLSPPHLYPYPVFTALTFFPQKAKEEEAVEDCQCDETH